MPSWNQTSKTFIEGNSRRLGWPSAFIHVWHLCKGDGRKEGGLSRKKLTVTQPKKVLARQVRDNSQRSPLSLRNGLHFHPYCAQSSDKSRILEVWPWCTNDARDIGAAGGVCCVHCILKTGDLSGNVVVWQHCPGVSSRHSGQVDLSLKKDLELFCFQLSDALFSSPVK